VAPGGENANDKAIAQPKETTTAYNKAVVFSILTGTLVSCYAISMHRTKTFHAIFEAADPPDIGYTVNVAELPGCISEGDTYEAALANIKDAMESYLLTMNDQGEEIPLSYSVQPLLEPDLIAA